MLYGEINRQRLKIINEHVVADTIDYLEARFAFSEDWDGLEKWVHFAKDGEVYDIRLTDDCIRKEDHLNLSAGIWKVYLHGNEFSGGKVIERITTNQAILKVEPTGALNGEPFPEMPASVTEQILARLDEVEQNGGGTGDGYSPEAKVERVEGGVRVTITDKDGTTSEVVQDGQPGVHVGSDAPPKGTKVWVNPNGKRTEIPRVDDTLTQPGYAADAKEVGKKINQLSEKVAGKADADDIPVVYPWALAELPFTKKEISNTVSGAGFVVNPTNFTDGKTYFRYHAGDTNFKWTNPNPQKGSLTITMRVYMQYATSGQTKIVTEYSDGTNNSLIDIMYINHGQLVTYVTDPDKTVVSIRGNYDVENWVLIDMSALSIVADYPAPTGTVKSVNGVLPDESGNVEIALPEGGGSGGTDIALGITGATVGQIARITAVDDAGVPTAWEAADMASENEKGWRYEKYITITEATAGFTLDAYDDGTPFDFTEAEVYVALKNSAESAEWGSVCLNHDGVTLDGIHLPLGGRDSSVSASTIKGNYYLCQIKGYIDPERGVYGEIASKSAPLYVNESAPLNVGLKTNVPNYAYNSTGNLKGWKQIPTKFVSVTSRMTIGANSTIWVRGR